MGSPCPSVSNYIGQPGARDDRAAKSKEGASDEFGRPSLFLCDDDAAAESGEFEDRAPVAVRTAERSVFAIGWSRAAVHRDREIRSHITRERRRIDFESDATADREMDFAGEGFELVAAATREIGRASCR